jgi:hypothetical protein
MMAVYGRQAQPFFLLDTPPNTYRLYTFHIETTRYRGEVTGEVINANKIHQNTPTFYSYYVRRGVVLSRHKDIPCP